MADQNVRGFGEMMTVCKSISKEKDDYVNLYEALPTLEAIEHVDKINVVGESQRGFS